MTSSPPRASVVVVTRNRAESLRRTLRAVSALTHPSYEILVVDHGSEDHTAQVAAEAGVRRHVCPSNHPLAHCRQLGVEKARGREVIAMCDDDCVPAPDWLDRLTGRLKSEPGLGLVGGRVINVGFPPGKRFKGRTRMVGPNGRLDFAPDPASAEFFGNANLGLRRSALEAVGGYDRRLPAMEEIDLALRFRRAGWGVAYEPEAVVEHHFTGPSDHKQRFRRSSHWARLHFYLKHFPPSSFGGWVRFLADETRLLGTDLWRWAKSSGALVLGRRSTGLRGQAMHLVNLVTSRLAIPWIFLAAGRQTTHAPHGKPLRLVYLAHSAIPCREANSVHVMKMCQAYARLGHEVTLMVPRPGDRAEPGVSDVHEFYGVEKSFRIVRIPLPTWLPDSLTYGVLLPLIAGLLARPHLVHSRSLPPAWGAARLLRRSTLYETHGPPSAHPRHQRFLTALTKSPNLASLIVITQALAREIQAHLPSPVPLVVAPDGVDEAWLDLDLSREEARRRLGLPTDGPRLVVYAGHLYPGRGVELILEMARRLPDHRFLLVGGSEDDLARHRARDGRPSNAEFLGFQAPKTVPTHLLAADVLMMPYGHRVAAAGGGDTSHFLSPMKMFEYMAAGRPILASRLPVLQEVLKDGVHALLCPYDEPDVWERALRRLAAEPELARRLGHNAREEVQRYTWERRARRLLHAVETRR